MTRIGYQHGSGASPCDKIEEMVVRHTIVDPLFRDVRVQLVSECGAHCESTGMSRQFFEFENYVQEDAGDESRALDHDRVGGGSADKPDKT